MSSGRVGRPWCVASGNDRFDRLHRPPPARSARPLVLRPSKQSVVFFRHSNTFSLSHSHLYLTFGASAARISCNLVFFHLAISSHYRFDILASANQHSTIASWIHGVLAAFQKFASAKHRPTIDSIHHRRGLPARRFASAEFLFIVLQLRIKGLLISSFFLEKFEFWWYDAPQPVPSHIRQYG